MNELFILRNIYLSDMLRIYYQCLRNSLLAKLRGNTGYPFTTCKNALEACNYDLKKAEEWLKEQALKLGWNKAYKLAGRKTFQGLVAVTTNQKSGTMVEVNCETDFVARNSLFRKFVSNITEMCFSVAKEQNHFENAIAKTYFNSEEIKKFKGLDGESVENEIALLISQVGEKILIRRALCLNVSDNLLIAGSTHPILSENQSILMGNYGSLLVYKSTTDDEKIPFIAKQLCQHIIGKKPERIGEIDKDQPKENVDNEECMIHQEFLMETELPVSQVLQETGISLIEFARFERGEDLEEEEINITPKISKLQL
ncbi:hypothetical protein PGB90_005893 [Kerria lacca]